MGVGSVVFLVGSPGTGKTHLASSFADRPDECCVLPRPRRLLVQPGAAGSFEAGKDSFDETRCMPDLREVLRQPNDFASTLVIMDDFLLFTPGEFRDLTRLLFQDLRHQRYCVVMATQAISSLPHLSVAVQQATHFFLMGSSSNHAAVSKLCRTFGFSKDKCSVLQRDLDCMSRRRVMDGAYDCLLLATASAFVYHNFITRPFYLPGYNFEEPLPLVTDMTSDGDRQYALLPRDEVRAGIDETGRQKKTKKKPGRLSEWCACDDDLAAAVLSYVLALPGNRLSPDKTELVSDHGARRCRLTALLDHCAGACGKSTPQAVLDCEEALLKRGFPLPKLPAKAGGSSSSPAPRSSSGSASPPASEGSSSLEFVE